MRKLIGNSDPNLAEIGSIRGDFSRDRGKNVIDSSLTKDEADRNIHIWFTE